MSVVVITSNDDRFTHPTATRWHIDDLRTLHIIGSMPRPNGVVSRVNGADALNIAAYRAPHWESVHFESGQGDDVSAEKVYNRITDPATSRDHGIEIIRRVLSAESAE